MARFARRRVVPEAVTPSTVDLPPPPPTRPDGLRSMADHRDYLLRCVNELPAFGQQILDARGLSLGEDIVAGINLPGFDNSAMDGYAVRAVDVRAATADQPVGLPVIGEVAAGSAARHRLAPGTAMKVMTGAPVPPGADTVVPYEHTDRGADDVAISVAAQPGQHIRRIGEDVTTGTQVLAAGHRLGPRDIGLLAGIGLDKVMVRPRPRVVVIATGTELVEPGRGLEETEQIYDSNSYLLAAAVRAAGAQVFRVGLVADDPAALTQLITDQLIRADLLLTTGGVSQGDYDIVKAVLPDLAATDFAPVAMQPGKPQGFGLIGEDAVPIVMLPGNPVSAYVSYEAFARPLIRKLMGITPYTRPEVTATAAHDITSIPGRRQFARGVVSTSEGGERRVELAGGHGSHLLRNLAQANALVVLAEDVVGVAAGDQVPVWLLDGPDS